MFLCYSSPPPPCVPTLWKGSAVPAIQYNLHTITWRYYVLENVGIKYKRWNNAFQHDYLFYEKSSEIEFLQLEIWLWWRPSLVSSGPLKFKIYERQLRLAWISFDLRNIHSVTLCLANAQNKDVSIDIMNTKVHQWQEKLKDKNGYNKPVNNNLI